ncbi:hypothetical protein [Demequina muriae]|uniref:Uncharacterized protein n=1 Tax=Demequina muriae TaxID=3051664 RepID=A0ABT8GEQ1_9MICO|nr:hypothetical protein [Demequina sp. EGI L300058]MDN4479905.1 hypothetical protein [Demequina sp. EGI L300058]
MTRPAMADARERLGLDPLPTGPEDGLLAALHADPVAALPEPSTARRDGALPVALLPVGHLTADARARGLSGGAGRAYAIDGRAVSAASAASLLADVLDDAAAILRAEEETVEALNGERRMIAGYFFDVAEPDEDVRETMRQIHEAVGWTTGAERALRSPGSARLIEDRADTIARLARALDATALSLRTSAAARRTLLPLVRDHLAPDAAPSPDEAAAFLARFDGEATVRRSTVWDAYETEGSPGALDRPALYALADDRWGRSVKSSGYPLWRPISGTRSRRPALRLS